MSEILSLDLWESIQASCDQKILKNIITDRRSKYTVVWWKIGSDEEAKQFVKTLLRDPYFRKATHNSYAYRIQVDNGAIREVKNDDGESWAWNCILRELQREHVVNTIIIVTRYFWGIQLHADRFKNVINGTKIFIKDMKK